MHGSGIKNTAVEWIIQNHCVAHTYKLYFANCASHLLPNMRRYADAALGTTIVAQDYRINRVCQEEASTDAPCRSPQLRYDHEEVPTPLRGDELQMPLE
jgi:hypothetical protein